MTLQRTTTSACQNRLPEVLIDYLWQLAGESDSHTFVLNIKYTGVGPVQDILHRHNNFASWHQVFGYPPVEAVVEVHVTGQEAVMSLQGDPAQTRANRKEALPCSA